MGTFCQTVTMSEQNPWMQIAFGRTVLVSGFAYGVQGAAQAKLLRCPADGVSGIAVAADCTDQCAPLGHHTAPMVDEARGFMLPTGATLYTQGRNCGAELRVGNHACDNSDQYDQCTRLSDGAPGNKVCKVFVACRVSQQKTQRRHTLTALTEAV